MFWTPESARRGEREFALLQVLDLIFQGEPPVLFVDGISDTFGGNENNRIDVKRYTNALLGLIDSDHGAVVLIGHVAKPTASGVATTEGYSGSTGWHNAARARWYLHPETERDEDGNAENNGNLILALQKSNMGRDDQSMRFIWNNEHNLFTGIAVTPQSKLDMQARDKCEQDGIMAALEAVVKVGGYCPAAAMGRRTAFHVLSIASDFPDSIRQAKSDKVRFWRHIETLRGMGRIEEGSYARPDRHKTNTLQPVSTGG